jgi:hypothetical protein
MADAALLIGWTRPVQGRESGAHAKLGEMIAWLLSLQMTQKIESFESVMLRPHGGDLNGFFLLRGDRGKLADLRETEQFRDWEAWGSYALEGFGVAEAALGKAFKDVLDRQGKFLR